MPHPRNELRVALVGTPQPTKPRDQRSLVRVLGVGTGVVVCLESTPPERRKSRRRTS